MKKIPDDIVMAHRRLECLHTKAREYFTERHKFIVLCIESRLTYIEIGKILGLDKQKVYRIMKNNK